MSLCVFIRSHSFYLSEAPDKIALGTESQNLADLGRGVFRITKHIAGCIDSAAQDIVRDGATGFLPEYG